MLLKTIFEISDLSEREKHMVLFPGFSTYKNRMKRGVAWEEIDRLVSYDEYITEKTPREMAYDLFLVMRDRGLFDEARQYEMLAQFDVVKAFDSIPRDLFMRNELEYYKWRKEH